MNVRGFEDYAGRELRLTDERLDHIERRSEMVDRLDGLVEDGRGRRRSDTALGSSFGRRTWGGSTSGRTAKHGRTLKSD